MNKFFLVIILILGLIIVFYIFQNPSPYNILIITIDAQRADHLSIYGYKRETSPNIDKFFNKSVVFENAYSTQANTAPSVVSFLTGLYPQDTGVRLIFQKVPKETMLISDYLSEKGYQTAGIVSNGCLAREAMDLHLHFDYYDDFVDQKEPYRKAYERNAKATTDAGIYWFSKVHDSKKPYFLWLHYQDPHGPYHPPDDKIKDFSHEHKELIDIERVPEYQREPGINDGQEYIDLYDEEIAYADHHIGRLLNYFERQQLLDNTIVILSADHGESMMEHEKWFTHSYHVYNEIIHVPLLIRYPKQEAAQRVETRVSLVDIVPTLLNILKIKPKQKLPGQVLDDSIEEKAIFSQGRRNRCMIYKNGKWIIIARKDITKAKKKYFFNIEKDPFELNKKQWGRETKEIAYFMQMLLADPDPTGVPKEYEKGMLIEAPKVRPGLNDETMNKLRSLGYVN